MREADAAVSTTVLPFLRVRAPFLEARPPACGTAGARGAYKRVSTVRRKCPIDLDGHFYDVAVAESSQ